MNKFFSKLGVLLFFSFFLLVTVSTGYAKSKKILVVTVTKGFKHQSIPVLEKVIEELGKSGKIFTVVYARADEELALKMNAQSLQNYDGVIFASTTGDLSLPSMEKQLKVILNVNDEKHSAVKDFGENYELFDEIYTFKNFNRANVRVLLSLDKNPNQNDKENFGKAGFYPIAWCREYGKGRVFYTALGHREDVLESEIFKKHLLGGIKWTLKQAKGSGKPN